jgi:recombination protein RecA
LYSDIPGRISTGSTVLDLLLGGGIPRARLTEILGGESLGKSTVCEHIIANAQREGLATCLIDFESTFDKSRAARIGISASDLLVLKPVTLEDAFEAMDSLVRDVKKRVAPDQPIVIVWDTIAAAPVRTEKEGKKYGEGIASKPRLLHEAFRRLTLDMAAQDVTLVLVNQIIDQIGSMGFGPKTESPGGRSIRHHTSVRLKISKTSPFEIKENDLPVGIRVKVALIKSKIPGSIPRGTVEIPIYNYTGIDDLTGMIEFCLEHKSELLTQKGGWYTLCPGQPEEIKFRFAQRRQVFSDPVLRELLRAEVSAIWQEVLDKIQQIDSTEEA